MRPALLAGLILVSITSTALAQTVPFLAVVTDPEVKLRAGPSSEYPDTATLKKGSMVLVIQEDTNGWLAVQDPPGKLHSISWVQMQLVNFDKSRPTPQNVDVDEAGATLRAGQLGLAQPLHISRTKVPGGTILTVLGPGVVFENKTWYPVLPPEGDFRYLPKQSVAFSQATNTAVAVRENSPTAPPAGGIIATSGTTGVLGRTGQNATTSGKPSGQNPLWVQAETAEKEGRYEDAEKLFFQLARLMNEPGGDHDMANLCYTRIHSLREKKRNGGTVPAMATGSLPAVSATRPSATNSTPTPLQTTPSASTPVASSGTKPGSVAPASLDTTSDTPRWVGPGKLSSSALALDGRQTYILERGPDSVIYVVAGPGVDLKRYVGKRVDVYGVVAARRGLSKPFVVTSAVEVVP